MDFMEIRKENIMYINQFEVSGIPKFYAKGISGRGEFYYLGDTLAYFSYPAHEDHMPHLPAGKDGSLLPITAKGFLHSEEYEEPVVCMDCGVEFEKRRNLTFLTVASFRLYEPEVFLGERKRVPGAGGTVLGDVHTVRAIEGKARDFYMARLAVKDITSPLGFSYMTVSSLHPFTVEKGDRLCSSGRLVTTRHCLNAICPSCSCVNSIVTDSVVLQASSVQSWNTAKAYFGEM